MPSPLASSPPPNPPRRLHPALRVLAWIVGLGAAGAACVAMVFLIAVALAYRNLPSIESLTDYRPKIPLRVYTSDGVLIGEFGDERRAVVSIGEVPTVMKQAILAAEDEHFYQHSGIDYLGVLRAGMNNLANGSFFGGGRRQGASTITQQIARNFFLSSEQSYVRKFYEALLTFKIEDNLSKDQILEVYINQIYLGEHAFGFASAERVYFGKPLKDVTVAEAAMLAGLPKAPSTNNPIVNPKRARVRQLYVLERMHAIGDLNDAQYEAAKAQPTPVKADPEAFAVHAEYVAEMARQAAFDQFHDETYSRGLNVYTTLISGEQNAAYEALRTGVIDYERRHGYNGPEEFVDLPSGDDAPDLADIVEDTLAEHPDSDDIVSAVVLEASPKQVRAARVDETITITGDGLKFAAASLNDKAPQAKRHQARRGDPRDEEREGQLGDHPAAHRPGRVHRRERRTTAPCTRWSAASTTTATSSTTSRRRGGSRGRASSRSSTRRRSRRASRRRRSSTTRRCTSTRARPAARRGIRRTTTAASTVRCRCDRRSRSRRTWCRSGCFRRSVRATCRGRCRASASRRRSIRPICRWRSARAPSRRGRWPARTPVFANGGYKINPYFISRIVDSTGHDVADVDKLVAGDPANRVIDARNAFVMDSLLRTVARSGTAAKVTAVLKRGDLAGKTGTTNDSHDAWFAGYSNDNLVGIAWMGFDQPKSLGDRETGGGLALPIWLGYMSKALKGVPEKERVPPPGVVNVAGEVYYVENQPGQGVRSLGLDDPVPDADGSTTPSDPVNPGSSNPPIPTPAPAPVAPTRPETPRYEDPRDKPFGA